MKAEAVDVWINCPDKAPADRIADAAIERRLAACANVMAPIESAYHWKGKVEREPEVPLVLKSRAALFDRLVAAVRELHPYETPAIVGLPVAMVNDDYLQWIVEETNGA